MSSTMPAPAASAIRTVLIGTSLSAASDEVVRTGVRIARACGARVHLVHAFEATLAYVTGPAYGVPAYIPELVESTRELESGRLYAQIARLGIGSAELAGVSVLEGPPHVILTETAAAIGADLLVVAAADRWGRVAKLLGSTADRVVRLASCPVLVARGELRIPPWRVLVGVDLSPISAEALARGVELIHALGAAGGPGVSVEVLFVAERMTSRWNAAGEPDAVVPGEAVAREALSHFLSRRANGSGCRMTPWVRTGVSAAAVILEMSEDLVPDLLVVGTHGRHGFQRAFLGSVAERVLRHAYCSVLVVPRAASLGAEAAAVQAEGAMVA